MTYNKIKTIMSLSSLMLFIPQAMADTYTYRHNGDFDASRNYDLEDIQALLNLEIIKGNLTLLSSSLKSLAGLEKLKEVGFINISGSSSGHNIDDITPL